MLWRLDHEELTNAAPKLVVLMIGINNFSETANCAASTPEETAEAVRRIVAKIRADHSETRILLLGTLPCFVADSPRREQVSRLNRLLERIPEYEQDGQVEYLDIGAKFLGATGEIPRALMADLLHPTDAGYAILARALNPYLEQVAEGN